MSRRGGGRQLEPRRSQPSPASSQPISAETTGMGRGRGGRGGARVPASSPAHAPPPSSVPVPATASQSTAATVASSSSSPPPPSVVSVSTETLTSEVERKLALQPSAPSSSKAVRFPDRPGVGRLGRKIQVRANHFQLQIVDRDLHQYDVTINPEIASKKVSRDVISKLVRMHRETVLGKRIPAYDGRKSLFTAGPLPFTSKDFVVKLDDDNEASGSAGKKRDREFKVTIRFVAKTDLYNLTQFLRRLQLDCPHETIQALDIVLRATASQLYNVVGRSFYSPKLGQKGPLGGGTEYWRGYYQSLRPTQMGLSLNIDVSARAFYEPIPVTEFISKHFNLNLNSPRPLSDQDRIKVKKALRGVKIRVTHGQNIRSYKVTGVSKEPLKELMFTLDDKVSRTSVAHYFRDKYKIELRYLVLPALQAGSETKPIYLPMELCCIEAGQRYSKRLSEDQVTNLLRATCQRPEERENYIKQIVKQHNFNADTFAREFGITVKEDLAVVDARVLPPPMLKYHESGRESRVAPRMGQWNMIDKKMVDGGNVKFWSCISFSTRINRELHSQFCTELVNMCIHKGVVFNQEPLIPITQARPNQLEAELVAFHKQCKAKLDSMRQEGGLQLLIVILPDVKGSYENLKRICETELGIVSQCCHPKQVVKVNRRQYLENVALKINVKVGGRNNVLIEAIERSIPYLSKEPAIIFGADVTHPQPGEDSSPSIAAVVASMDWPWFTKYRGIVSAQTHREEIIQDLYKTIEHPDKGSKPGGMIRELILAFYRSTGGHKPRRIIFFRDGVSEGQFSQVLLYEMDAIRKACASFETGYMPPVTFVVVQKRHHTRLFPINHRSRDQTDKSGNIMPGTVVDSGICHPREFDFYLNTHAGIQGTSRPAHYHVLYDENNFTSDQLQSLINNLCYTYARCTRSVSIVPPAYYAHLAAFRARCYIDRGTLDAGSGSGARSTSSEVTLPSIKENVKEVMFYC